MQNQDLQDFQDKQGFDSAYKKVRQNPVHPENPANPDSAFTFRGNHQLIFNFLKNLKHEKEHN